MSEKNWREMVDGVRAAWLLEATRPAWRVRLSADASVRQTWFQSQRSAAPHSADGRSTAKVCERCRQTVPLAAQVFPEDAGKEAPGMGYGFMVYRCRSDDCESSVRHRLYSRFGTYSRFQSSRGEPNDSVPEDDTAIEVRVIPARPPGSQPAAGTRFELAPTQDRIDPHDHRREMPPLPTASLEILSRIDDRLVRHRIVESLVSDDPEWFGTKFGGFPHWRALELGLPCTCFVPMSLVFTFDNAACPAICDPGESAYLFACLEAPVPHFTALVLRRDLRDEEWEGKVVQRQE